MKPLLRPFLFIVARLGLFLTVMTWAITQNWWLSINSPLLVGDVLPGGYLVGFGYPVARWDVRAEPVRNDAGLAWVFRKPSLTNRENVRDLVAEFHAVGITYANYGGLGHFSVRHWLVVSIFAFANLVLRCVYRKREASPQAEN